MVDEANIDYDRALRDEAIVAYLDESIRPVRDHRTRRVKVGAGAGLYYVVAAAVVFHADADDLRASLKQISSELMGGSPIRFSDIARRKRRRVLEALLELGDWEACVYETAAPYQVARRTEHHIRALTLRAAFTHLTSDRGVELAVVETRSEPSAGFVELDRKDVRLVQSLRDKDVLPASFTITHATKAEPILWLADVVASVRTEYLCWGRDRELWHLLWHRVRAIVPVG